MFLLQTHYVNILHIAQSAEWKNHFRPVRRSLYYLLGLSFPIYLSLTVFNLYLVLVAVNPEFP